jgi:predicted amidophosphoribosyltransferase
MALEKCPECDQKVSSSAKRCPKCGDKLKTPVKDAAKFIGGLAAVGVLFHLLDKVLPEDKD